MEVSPWPFLAVGLLVGGVAAFFIICTQVLKKRISNRALELFHKGATHAQACEQLVAEGTDAAMCSQIVEKVVHRMEIGRATSLLEKGATRDQAEREMAASGMDAKKASDLVAEADLFRWCRLWRYLTVPAGVLLFMVGAALLLLSLVLRDGNLSGKFVTFPFAGTLTRLLGTALLCFGLVLLIGVFKTSF